MKERKDSMPRSSMKGKGKQKKEKKEISKEQLQTIMEKIAQLQQDVTSAERGLEEYYLFLKQRGINIAVLKKVISIYESETKNTFQDYWEKYTDAEEQLPEQQYEVDADVFDDESQ